MAKASGRAALRTSEVAAPIDVVRDGVSEDKKHARATSKLRVRHDGDARLVHEVSEDLRLALVPDRIAEAVARQLETATIERVRASIRQHLSSDLRMLLRKHARNGFIEADPADVLNETLADTIADAIAEALAERFPTALRERLPVAIRAATARGALAKREGGSGIDDLADRLSAMVEAMIRRHLGTTLRSVVRGRVADVAREDAREVLRVGATPEDAGLSPTDQIASVAEAIERAAGDHIARGVIERFRALIAGSLHHATGERLGDSLHRTLARFSSPVVPAARSPVAALRGRSAADDLDRRLEGPLTECIRGRLMEGLKERVETTCRENVDEVLRERLVGAIRLAIAEQRGSEQLDTGRLAEVINYELAEVLRARICDGIRARTAEAVRTRLAGAIRSGVARASIA